MISADNSPYHIDQGIQLRSLDPQRLNDEKIRLLQKHLHHAAKTPYYNRIFNDSAFAPTLVSELTDLQSLPLTDRSALQEFGNDFIAPGISICDISHTSGTTGEPVIVPYTANDLHRLAYNEALAFHSAGVKSGDTVLLTVTLDRCFIAGLAYYHGAILLGAAVIRSGPGAMAQQWKLLQKLRPTVILGVPSFLLSLARWGIGAGHKPSSSSIEKIITIGETVRQSDMQPTTLGRLLTEIWQAPVFSSYGTTEVETAFGECTKACGGHVHPDLMIVEIVDEKGNVVADGIAGEVVVTPLGVEGFPLIRFRTGDIARKHSSPCACGWNTERLGPIEGRLCQRLKCKGTTLYPEMILQILQEMEGTEDSYIEVRQPFDLADEIRVVIGTDDSFFSADNVRALLQARLRVTPEVTIHPLAEVLARTGKGKIRKPRRFFDLRQETSQADD